MVLTFTSLRCSSTSFGDSLYLRSINAQYKSDGSGIRQKALPLSVAFFECPLNHICTTTDENRR
ncbi:hypothetical protein BDA96_06G048600 [Sorghum bicolor]|uniref:Uncharacterized protein n=2 Tax=Sorghum bicolor TaxID=4558 RepID=A0A921QNI8_SORBI|nr:hypothetical protein BDA96_06G048600 [Sorghum bicolor]OQU81336.1 hypothetical protein SORBI_3006G044301 [Sorghum bicolor]